MTSTDWPVAPSAPAHQPVAPPPSPSPDDAGATPTRLRRLVRGRPEDPAWARPALVVLLAGTAILYLWSLAASSWANSFYSAAVQAGSRSWKAFLFGSSDAANSITVDKPPLSLWPMELSVRLFGLSSAAILVPQALMGVATVGVVFRAVRRWFGAAAGLIAGLVLALTPVAALMFRFNNPDALLTLLLALSAYAALLAIETGRWRWFAVTGIAVGLGFLTKQLQVLLVVPGFALAHLAFGDRTLWRRVRQLAVAGAAMVASAGWWIAVVELVPASMRPYVGGSQTNSVLELTFGYNGFGRLTGNETGSVGGGGGPGGASMWGATGIGRLFGGEIGGQISWLLPAALVLLVATAIATWRAPRRDLRRASLAVWGSWLVVTGLVFSFMGGIFHAYYTVALAPAVAALVGIGLVEMWRRRSHPAALVVLAVATGLTTGWARVLLGRAAGWNAWLSTLVLGAGGAAVAGLLVAAWCTWRWDRSMGATIAAAVAPLVVVAALAGPAAWTIQTVATPHTGSIVTAGPTVQASFGPGGGRGFGPGGGRGFGPGGGFGPPAGAAGGFTPPAGAAGGRGGMGGLGGLLGAATPSKQVVAALEQDADRYTWVAAAVGSNNASGYQLATQLPVMAIGGFNGSDPSPTVTQFQRYVAAGRIHWFLGGGGFGGQQGGSEASSQIATWVQEHFTATTIGGVTMYDLTARTHLTARPAPSRPPTPSRPHPPHPLDRTVVPQSRLRGTTVR